MGNDVGRWLAMLETGGDEARAQVDGLGRTLGNIEVLLQDEQGEWAVEGSVGETGPIAADTRVVPLSFQGKNPRKVRLRLTQGMWRVDQVALVSLGGEVTPKRIMPTEVTRDGVADASALRALVDREDALVTLPGDAWTVRMHSLPSRAMRMTSRIAYPRTRLGTNSSWKLVVTT